MTPPSIERVLDDCVNPECLDRIHDALQEMWIESGNVAELDQTMFEIALIEVAGNVVQHGGSGEGFDCRITITLTDATLVAELSDTGDRVDIDVDAAGLPDDESEHGRGLAMARSAADQLTYQHVDGRNLWSITRYRAAVA